MPAVYKLNRQFHDLEQYFIEISFKYQMSNPIAPALGKLILFPLRREGMWEACVLSTVPIQGSERSGLRAWDPSLGWLGCGVGKGGRLLVSLLTF